MKNNEGTTHAKIIGVNYAMGCYSLAEKFINGGYRSGSELANTF
jgi:hypothetical protein